MALQLRLHRPRRDPARPGQLALPRRRGGLLAGAGAGARGLPPGRRRGRDHVRPPRAPGPRGARLMGQSSYIYEAGCAFAIDGETTLLTGESPRRGRHGLREDRAPRHPEDALRALRGAARVPLALAHGRVLSHLFRGKVDVEEANELLRERPRRPAPARQRRDRPRDAGRRGRTHAYHLVPKRSARRAPSPPTPAPAATTRPTASRSATRSRTSRSPPRSAASSSSPTGPSATPACAPRSRLGQRHRHRGCDGRGLLRGGRHHPGGASLRLH